MNYFNMNHSEQTGSVKMIDNKKMMQKVWQIDGSRDARTRGLEMSRMMEFRFFCLECFF